MPYKNGFIVRCKKYVVVVFVFKAASLVWVAGWLLQCPPSPFFDIPFIDSLSKQNRTEEKKQYAKKTIFSLGIQKEPRTTNFAVKPTRNAFDLLLFFEEKKQDYKDEVTATIMCGCVCAKKYKYAMF